MCDKKLARRAIPFAILGILLAVLGYMLLPSTSNDGLGKIVPVHGIYFTEPNYLNPFQLKSTSKRATFTDQDLQGHWTLMFFGFTHCPDICPTTLAMLNTSITDFKKTSPKFKEPKVVFVSVDPDRDKISMLKKYVTYFNPNFTAATGSEDALRGLTRQSGIVFDKVILDDADPSNYAVEHSTSIILVNPRGAIQAIFTAPHDSATLTTELTAVYEAYQKGK